MADTHPCTTVICERPAGRCDVIQHALCGSINRHGRGHPTRGLRR